MATLMLSTPYEAAPGLVFLLTNRVEYSVDGDPMFWNDTSVNGFDASCEGEELPTFFDSIQSFYPLEDDLEVWLTFDAYALTNNPNLTYPTNVAPPTSPKYVLDRSGNNRSATVIGNVTFGVDDDIGSMSMLRTCYQGALSIPGLVGLVWNSGFTVTVYFRRTGIDRYQSIIGNGFSPHSSFELRMAPGSNNDNSDEMQCYASFEVCLPMFD